MIGDIHAGDDESCHTVLALWLPGEPPDDAPQPPVLGQPVAFSLTRHPAASRLLEFPAGGAGIRSRRKYVPEELPFNLLLPVAGDLLASPVNPQRPAIAIQHHDHRADPVRQIFAAAGSFRGSLFGLAAG